MIKHSVILSGGKGTRMLPITKYIPKGLIEVDGVGLMSDTISKLKNQNIDQTYITYGHLSEKLFEEYKHQVSGFINTNGEDNSYFLFNSIISELDVPVVVITSDLRIDVNYQEIYEDYINQGSPAIMIVGGVMKPGVDGDGIITNENNDILLMNRETNSKVTGTGLQIINPKKVNKLCERNDNFYGVWEQLFSTPELKLSSTLLNEWVSYDNINQLY